MIDDVDSVLSILVRVLQYHITFPICQKFNLEVKDSLRHEFRLKKIYPHALCLLYHGMSMLNGEAFYVFFYDKKQLHVEPRKVHMYVCIRYIGPFVLFM